MNMILLSVFFLALPRPVFADTINWDAHGVCEVYRGGRIIGRADNEQCRQIEGSNFNWDRTGTCYEWTPGGVKIGRGDIEDCRQGAGSHYRFDDSGACYELTATNVKIQMVRSHYCTDDGGGFNQDPLGPRDLPGGALDGQDDGNEDGTIQPDVPAPIAIQPPPTLPLRPRPAGPLRTGYNWSDKNHTMCVLYSSSGYALHMAPPLSCKK